MITHKKMSLFDAPKGSILVHGCNAQGVWGSGIAAPFKAKYPEAFEEYKAFCEEGLVNRHQGYTGRAYISQEDNGHFVGCLITSCNYGSYKDSPDDILVQTTLSLQEFFDDRYHRGLGNTPVYSNKFNSGLFNVEWSKTEKVLQYFVSRYNVEWIVCDPDMK